MRIPHENITASPLDVAALCALVKEMRERHGVCRVVEVGTWLGHTALAMLAAGAVEVRCVDTWEGTDDPKDQTGIAAAIGRKALYAAFQEHVGVRLGRGIYPYVGTSLYWAERWPAQAELVFLDADHREPAVRADIAAWAPHMRPGGILCGHDFGTWEGVTAAVSDEPHECAGQSLWMRRIG